MALFFVRTRAEHACSVDGALGAWVDFETECRLFNLVAVKLVSWATCSFVFLPHPVSALLWWNVWSRDEEGEMESGFSCMLNYSVYIFGGGLLFTKEHKSCVFVQRAYVRWTLWFCAQLLINRLVMTGWRLWRRWLPPWKNILCWSSISLDDIRSMLFLTEAQSVVTLGVYSSRGSGSAPWPLTSTVSRLWAADPQLCWASPSSPVLC